MKVIGSVLNAKQAVFTLWRVAEFSSHAYTTSPFLNKVIAKHPLRRFSESPCFTVSCHLKAPTIHLEAVHNLIVTRRIFELHFILSPPFDAVSSCEAFPSSSSSSCDPLGKTSAIDFQSELSSDQRHSSTFLSFAFLSFYLVFSVRLLRWDPRRTKAPVTDDARERRAREIALAICWILGHSLHFEDTEKEKWTMYEWSMHFSFIPSHYKRKNTAAILLRRFRKGHLLSAVFKHFCKPTSDYATLQVSKSVASGRKQKTCLQILHQVLVQGSARMFP